MVPLSEDEIDQRLVAATAPVIDALTFTTLSMCASNVALDRLAAALTRFNVAMEISELEAMFTDSSEQPYPVV